MAQADDLGGGEQLPHPVHAALEDSAARISLGGAHSGSRHNVGATHSADGVAD